MDELIHKSREISLFRNILPNEIVGNFLLGGEGVGEIELCVQVSLDSGVPDELAPVVGDDAEDILPACPQQLYCLVCLQPVFSIARAWSSANSSDAFRTEEAWHSQSPWFHLSATVQPYFPKKLQFRRMSRIAIDLLTPMRLAIVQ